MAQFPHVTMAAVKEGGANLFLRLAFGLNFLVFAVEVGLFGFHIKVGEELAIAVSPWMGFAAVFYIGFQVGAVVATQILTRAGAFWDVLMSIVLVGYMGATLIFGDIVEVNAFFPWDWDYEVDLFTADFIRNFGIALLFELLLVISFYFRFFQQQTEVSRNPT